MFGLKTTSGPADEPVSLDDAKQHLRVDHTLDDVLIGYWIAAARSLTEKHTNRRWLTQSLRMTLEAWPGPWPWSMGAQANFVHHTPPPLGYRPDVKRHMLFLSGGYPVRFPVSPVQSVQAVTYFDFVGTVRTIDPSLWQLWADHSPPVLAPAPLQVWPALQVGRLAPVTIDFTAGYGDSADSVPPEVRPAVLLALGYWYEHRGDSDDPAKLGLPPAALRLLDAIDCGGYV